MRISDWSSDVCSSDLAIDGLKWAEGVGGLKGLVTRSEANLKAMADWVGRTAWVDFLAADPAIRSSTSICLKIVDPWFQGLDDKGKAEVPKRMAALLEAEGVAYARNGLRDAPPGLRIRGGSTVADW